MSNITEWKHIKSDSKIKAIQEGWFIAWQKGNDEIEIIRYYNEDNVTRGDFEVWYQIKQDDGSWEGEHLGSFKSIKKAVAFATEYIKNF